jgi:hypothetical protein
MRLEVNVSEDGAVLFSDELWQAINGVAHHIRDASFTWYFATWGNAEDAHHFLEYLQQNSLRHELEYHNDMWVFVLPKADEGRHTLPGTNYDVPDRCAFCEAPYTVCRRLIAQKGIAICDECVERFAQALGEGEV